MLSGRRRSVVVPASESDRVARGDRVAEPGELAGLVIPREVGREHRHDLTSIVDNHQAAVLECHRPFEKC